MPHQAELAERRERDDWARLMTTAAAEMGVDIRTYTTLVMLQHRDITPEDFDVLQALDDKDGLVGGMAPTTLTQEMIERLLPVWVVPPSGEAEVSTVTPAEEDGLIRADGPGYATLDHPEPSGHGDPAPLTDASELDACGCTLCGSAPPRHVLRDLQCSVCLEFFEEGQTARTLPCKHHFHASCIDVWLTGRSRNCPVDKLPVVASDEASPKG
jgi:hypothetical protein